MRRSVLLAALAMTLGAATLAAQGPMGAPGGGDLPGGPPPGMPPGPPPAADFLLGHTGELRLSDAQVVRLAAIARRAAERRESQRPAAPPQQRPSDADLARMRQQHEQMREQARTDLRDALAVLTADQQARAWEMIGRGGHPGGPGGAPPPMDGRAPGRGGDAAPPQPPRPQG
ncbi:MAG TPA: hypothetical protein VF092_03435 [Longimicrobium sp.]